MSRCSISFPSGDGLLQAHVGVHGHAELEGTFLQCGHVLPPHEREKKNPQGEDSSGDVEDLLSSGATPLEERRVSAEDGTNQGGVFHLLSRLPTKDERPRGRDDEKGEEEGPDESRRDGEAHGPEHDPFGALEGEDGKEDQDDHEDGEEDGAGDLLAAPDQGRDPVHPALDVTMGVLDVDDARVCDEADADGQTAEGHEVRRQAHPLHDDEGEENREGQAEHGEEGRRQVSHEEEEDTDDQSHTHHQIPGHRPEARLHESGLVVEGNDPDPLGEARVHGIDPLLEPLDDPRRIGSEELQDQPHDLLPVSVGQSGAPCDGGKELHPGHTGEEHRCAPAVGHHDGLQILHRLHQTDAPDNELLGPPGDEARRRISVSGLDPLHEVGEGEVELEEGVGVHQHLELLDVASDGEDLGDLLDRLELELDQPVLQRSELHGGLTVALQVVHVDHPEARGDGAEEGIGGLGGKVGLDLVEPGSQDLAGPIDVGSLLEIHVHQREPVGGGASDALHLGQAEHGCLDGNGYELFHLLGRQTVGFGIDLHQGGGRVREHVDDEVPIGHESEDAHHHGYRHHHEPLGNRGSGWPCRSWEDPQPTVREALGSEASAHARDPRRPWSTPPSG